MAYVLSKVFPGDLVFLEKGEGPFIVISREGDDVDVLNDQGERETLIVDDWPEATFYPHGALKAVREFEDSIADDGDTDAYKIAFAPEYAGWATKITDYYHYDEQDD